MTRSAGGASPAGTYTWGFSSGMAPTVPRPPRTPYARPPCRSRPPPPPRRPHRHRPRRRAHRRLVLAAQRRSQRPRGARPAGRRERRSSPTSLAHTDDLQATLFQEMKARIKETDLSVPFRKGGRWFYSRTEEGQQYPILCRTDVEPPAGLPEGAPMPGEQVLLDLNVLAGDSDYFALGRLRPRARARTGSSTPRTTTAPSSTRSASATCAPAPTSPTSSPRPPTAPRGRATTRSSTCGPTPPCGRTRCGATRSARPPATTCSCTRTPTSASSSASA